MLRVENLRDMAKEMKGTGFSSKSGRSESLKTSSAFEEERSNTGGSLSKVDLEADQKAKPPQDHYHEWNPMEGMSKSLLNSSARANDGFLGGVEEMDVEDVLCPFNDGSGRCYKTSCRYKHVPYSSDALKGLPKLYAALQSKKEPLLTASSLPTQVLPATGCITKGVVTAAFEPGNFYILPENGWKCLCRTDDVYDDRGRERTWYETLNEMQTKLLNLHQEAKLGQVNEFLCGELVAVKLPSINGRKAWYRAEVLADSVLDCDDEEDIFKPVDVALDLIDFGVSCVKSSVDIVALPMDFVNTGRLAYKCQLNGISPLMGIWSTSAIKRFKELVRGQNILAEVVRTAAPSISSSACGNVEDNKSCCLVKVFVKAQDGQYINVAKDLADAALGISWSL